MLAGTPETTWPLSKAQEAFWLYSRPERGLPPRFNHLPLVVTLRGQLDRTALQSALERVVERHAALRTVIVAGPVLRQYALEPQPFTLPFADLSDLQPGAQAIERARLVRETAFQPFNFHTTAPWRALLIRSGERHHELILVLHHMICDGWSQRIGLVELAAFYGAGIAGEPARVEAVSANLFDFAEFERQRLESGELEEQGRYWSQQMRGAPEGVAFPTDREAGATTGSPGSVERFAIPAELFAQIGSLARERRVTPFTVLLAAYLTWLNRVTGQKDVWATVPVGNRARAKWKNAFGCIATRIPIRVDFSDNPAFSDVLDKTHSLVRSGMRRQEAPYLGWEDPGRAIATGSPGIRPLTTMFAFQDTLAPRFDAGGVSFETEVLWDLTGVAREAVVLQFQRSDGGLEGFLEYRTDLFRPETARRWIRDLLAILNDAVTAPDRLARPTAMPFAPAPQVAPALRHGGASHEPIAIVGIGCRFPGGSGDPVELWDLLRSGRDGIGEIPPDRFDLASFYSPDPGKPGKTYALHGGFVANVDSFDAAFFGIAPREAAQMDPQQRLALELAYEALEDAGIPVARVAGKNAGVFMAACVPDYAAFRFDTTACATIDGHSASGTSPSIVSNRISYAFDLRGPSLTLDTACSGSLVAIHQACRSIWDSGCTFALAGGVQLNIGPTNFVMFAKASMLSRTGKCRAFDTAADGFVRGEGGGIVVLKPLSAARRDKDRVYALIRGVAINQDGRTPSLTMPSFDAQVAAIREALREAGVAGETVQYVEAHGPGTQAGDPIEAGALGAALGGRRPDACVVGSIKTNIGHLEAGAGVAGLIKLALSLWHRQIPPNLHFQTLNPKISRRDMTIRVPVALEPWPPNRDGLPRLGGVNSFGFGGTNAHAIVQEGDAAPEGSSEADSGRAGLLLLSTRSEAALADLARSFCRYLAGASDRLSDIAYTAAARRSHHPYRLAVSGSTRAEWMQALEAFLAGEARRGVVHGRAPERVNYRRPVFVFSGMGQQHARMGLELFATEAVFRDAVLAVDAEARPHIDWSLARVFSEGAAEIDRTEVAQVAIFAMQVGLAALWESWGVEPEAVTGHSVGEVAAAYVAGALSLADAVAVVCHRSRLQAETAGGAMLAVGMAESELRIRFPFDEKLMSIAAVNSPRSVTLAGDGAALNEIAARLTEAGVFNRPLRVEVPYHSPAMDPLMPRLVDALSQIRPRATHIRLISTVTGQLLAGTEMTPQYWAMNMRAPVHFADAIASLQLDGLDCFIEIAAHPVLNASLKECLGADALAPASLRRGEPERKALLNALGSLFLFGYPLDWSRLSPANAQLVFLPAYPWQRTRYWSESESMRRWRLGQRLHPLLGSPAALPSPAWFDNADLDRLPFLRDHRLHGEAVFPFAGYVETALAAAREASQGRSCALVDMRMEKAFILQEEVPNPFCVVFEPGRETVAISSPSGSSFIRHFSARVVNMPPEPEPLDVEAIRQRCSELCGGEEVYRRLKNLGYDYGPAFRGVRRAWFGEGEALFEVEWPEAATPNPGFRAHPAVLDAYLNGAPLIADSSETWIPTRCGEIALIHPLPREGWSYARLTKQSADMCSIDLMVADLTGRLTLLSRGLQYRALAKSATGRAPRDLVYRTVWESQALGEPLAVEPGASWLIFADRNGVGELLAALLRRAGGLAVLVFRGDEARAIGPDRYILGAASREAVRSFLASVGSFTHSVYLWGADSLTEDAEVFAAQEQACLGAVFLTQALLALERIPQLWVVVRGAWRVLAGDIPSVGATALWGMGRTIFTEHPELRVRLVDLDNNTAEDPGALLREIASGSEENEVALRGVGRWVPRLEHAPLTRPAGDSPFRLAIREAGSIDNLIFTPAPPVCPGFGEVAIGVAAAGLNFKDVVKALGRIDAESLAKTSAGHTLGAECAGRVISVGPGVTGISAGDEVVALAPNCFTRVAIAPARFVTAKPAHMTFGEAATLPVAYLTAYYALCECARIQPGDRLLIHSAAGGVGQAALRIAECLGVEVLATAGSHSRREWLRSQGVACVMDSRSLAFGQETLAASGGHGVDVVLNTLPPATIPTSLEALRPRGRFIDISNIYSDAALDLRAFQKGLSATAFDLDQLMQTDPDFIAGQFRQAIQFVAERGLPPVIRTEFPLHRAGEAFRFMAKAQHIGKLVLIPEPAPDAPVDVSAAVCNLSADATYLVTGGTAGFGMYTARWLADSGARHLALLSRSGRTRPGDEVAEGALADLAARGVTVRLLAADLSKREEVAAVLREIESDMPPLRGVIHSATIYADCAVQNLDAESLGKVLLPKALGAWNLHELTRQLPLDFFILYSSVAALLGSAGQGAYAAANAFLDGLAGYRRWLGLPALSVAWGPIAVVGMVSRHESLARMFEDFGLPPLQPEGGMKSLGVLLDLDTPTALVADVDWSAPVPGSTTPRYSRVAAVRAKGPEAVPVVDRIAAADPDERPALLAAEISRAVGAVLGTGVRDLDNDTPLTNLGLDSLLAVELSSRLVRDLHVEVSAVRLQAGPTIHLLAHQLVPQVLAYGTKRRAPTQPARSAEPAVQPVFVSLSWQQLAIWDLVRRAPGHSLFNLPAVIRLRGRFDTSAFAAAIAKLVERHATLRAVFHRSDTGPMQSFPSGTAFETALEDLSDTREDEREAVIEARERAFSLAGYRAGDPVFRVCILRFGALDHAVLMSVHRLAADAASLQLLVRDAMSLYLGITLEPQTWTYADFVRWQHEALTEHRVGELTDFWRGALSGCRHVLPLPFDHERPTDPSFEGASVPFDVPSSVALALRELCRTERCSLSATLLTALGALIYRVTGADDFCVGTFTSNRMTPESRRAVGCFIDQLPLRIDMRGDPSLRVVARRVRETALAARAHAELPFAMLMNRLPGLFPPGQPTIQVALIYHGELGSRDRFRLRGPNSRLEVGYMECHNGGTCRDWTFHLYEEGDSLRGSLEYDAQLFSAASALEIATAYVDALKSLANYPDAAVQSIRSKAAATAV